MKDLDNFNLFTSIGDLLTDGIVLFNLKKQRVIYANAAATELTGIQRENDISQVMQLWKQVKLEDRAYISSQFQEMLNKPVSRTAEFEILRNGEKTKHLYAMACVEHNKSVLAIFLRDITWRKDHEDYLVEFGIKKNTLLDTLTHNLSGSLNLTRHLARQAEKHATEDNKELQSVLGLITESTTASIRVIEDFVEFEYEKAPRIHIKTGRIDLVEKVGFIYEQLQNSYPERSFHLLSESAALHVTTDEVKLLQVLNNLTSNALKFSPPESPVIIRISTGDKQAIISVKDQGIGIPQALKPLIFLRQPTTGRQGLNGEPSNGKGLAICKSLMELLGGNIWFESAENSGTTFFISLPYVLDKEEKHTDIIGQ